MFKKFTFSLRVPFQELSSVCYILNRMIISGNGNHAEVKVLSDESESNDCEQYLEINMYRCRSYASISLNIDILPVSQDLILAVALTDFQKSVLSFEADEIGNTINIYICDSYAGLPKSKSCRLQKFNKADYGTSPILLDVKFSLRKPFNELILFAPIVNNMMACGARSHITVSSDNHFSISFIYNSRLSLSLTIGLVKGSFPKKDVFLLTRFNISCSRKLNPLKALFAVLPRGDGHHGQIIHLYVYKPKDEKLLKEIEEEFISFGI